MLTEKKKLIFLKKLFPILIISICLLMSIGYATVNDVFLNVEGEAVAMIPEGIYVTNIIYLDSHDADYSNSNINVVDETLLNHKIILSTTDSNSYVAYVIEVFNGSNYDWEFKGASFDPQFYDNHDITFSLDSSINPGDVVPSGCFVSFSVTFKYKDGVTPSELNNVLNAHINYEFIPCAVLMSTSDNDTRAFRSSAYKENIKNITFENEINVPDDAIKSWDIGVSKTGDVMAYVVSNESDSTYYDLYIQSDTQLYGNEDMSYWFARLKNVDSINGLTSINTSNVTNMHCMFLQTGRNSEKLILDISGFDTGNVTDMGMMFYVTGENSTVFTLDLGDNFDTSNVTDMAYMFSSTGYKSTEFTLDVSGFDTSKVTNMGYMFRKTGYNSTVFTLDVSNFDTSNVTDMSDMFLYTGYSSSVFTLDVSGFDTSKVTKMSSMFDNTGYNSTVFTLDVSNFDTTNVTKMRSMFNSTGYKSTEFTIDVSGFDTSNVTDMHAMFYYTGYNNPNFTLDVSGFDTSKVTDIGSMFYLTGYNSTKLNTSITIRNPNTTSYSNMFRGVATKSGTKITVNYTSETSDLVDLMIATKREGDNVVKGWNVDVPITFSIDGNTYNAYEGMTWGQWIYSEFNDGRIDEYNGHVGFDGMDLINENSTSTSTSSKIVSGFNYELGLSLEDPF